MAAVEEAPKTTCRQALLAMMRCASLPCTSCPCNPYDDQQRKQHTHQPDVQPALRCCCHLMKRCASVRRLPIHLSVQYARMCSTMRTVVTVAGLLGMLATPFCSMPPSWCSSVRERLNAWQSTAVAAPVCAAAAYAVPSTAKTYCFQMPCALFDTSASH